MTDSDNIQLQTKFKILLVGDSCTDIYDYGTVDRISPEAPVPVFKFSYRDTIAGMAGNVYNNLVMLGCDVEFYHGPKSIKTRLIDIRSHQHLLRIDDDKISEPIEFKDIDLDILKSCDAVVISDYDKGFVSQDLIDSLIDNFEGPVFIDTKKRDLATFKDAFVKINELEFNRCSTFSNNMIVTLGARGARFRGKVFPAPAVEVSDVTGAGDTFISSLAVRYLETKDIEEAIRFANRAASVTVQHVGVYAPKREEIG